MEPTYKMSELLKKKRPVPRKFNTYKDFDASLFKGQSGQIPNVPDLSTYINKYIVSKTPERTRPNSILNYSHIPEIKPSGKENRSFSLSKKEERASSVKRNMRDRQHNYSMLNDKPLAVDMSEIDQKRAELTNKFQVYLSSDRKSGHKRNLSSKRTTNAPTQYRRLNSSYVETRQRALSQDKRSAHTHKNSSLLNNSLMLDEPGNISRDQSYLKELLEEDTSHVIDAHAGGLNMSPTKLEEIYEDNLHGVNITNHEFSRNYPYDDSAELQEKNRAGNYDKNAPLYDKGKQLFREKKYEEGINYLKDSLEQEDRTTEALYLLGVSYLWLGQYDNAIKEFKALLDLQPSCHKNVYVLLSIAYKKINDIASAIKTLNRAISKHPKYYDAFIFKGKLLLKEKQWERALSDFVSAAKLKPQKNLALIGQGDALRMLGEYDKAIECYTQAIERSPASLSTALLKRAIVLIEAKRLDDALKDLERTIKIDPNHSEAYYFKGFVLEKKKDFSEAILCFEQAIKHKSSRKAVLKSLYEIARIKIEQRNFYEAYHTLHRVNLLELEEKAFSKLKLFTEGVIHLMKRKFEEGVVNLTEVIKKQDPTDSFRPMAFNYRAYGYFCCDKIKEALEDYRELQKISKLDQGSNYNKFLCEGILAAEADNPDLALKKFAQALKIFPNKMEPHFYRAVITINSFYKSHPKFEDDEVSTGYQSAIADLEKCLQMNDNCSNLYYIRAVVFYALGKFSHAHQSIEKAIEKADENYAKYYYLRGAIFACTQSYYNAVSDLSIAINLDKDLQPAYLERAKCYFTLGDLKQAFIDIQDYITVKSDDSNIHLWAGNLLFCTGAYEDAVKAYSNSETLNDSESLLALRVKCNIILKELNLALNDLDRLLELKTGNNIYYYIDRECLVALKTATASGDEELEKDGLLKAIQKVSKVISYKVSGNAFALHDLYFYKSVFEFYLGEFQAALDDLEKSWEMRDSPIKQDKEVRKSTNGYDSKEMIKLLEDVYSNPGSDEIKEDNGKTGSIDAREYLFNKAIYLLMLKRFEDSLDIILQLRTMVPPEISLEFDILVNLINEQIQEVNEDSERVLSSSKSQQDVPQEIIIFPYTNRLCSIFPSVRIPFSSKAIYTMRLSFCLPSVEPPSFLPAANYSILSEIKVTSVENKPEAPWIRRTFGGVVFTENYMEKEEREIENLKEVIEMNGLKEEEIYKSLANSQRTITQDSNNALNQALIIDKDINTKQNNPVFIAEDIFPESVPRGRMIKSKTGGI